MKVEVARADKQEHAEINLLFPVLPVCMLIPAPSVNYKTGRGTIPPKVKRGTSYKFQLFKKKKKKLL